MANDDFIIPLNKIERDILGGAVIPTYSSDEGQDIEGMEARLKAEAHQVIRASLGDFYLPEGDEEVPLDAKAWADVDKWLAKRRELQVRMQQIDEIADMREMEITMWRNRAKSRLIYQLGVVENDLLEVASRAMFPSGKSMELANGTIGRKSGQKRLELVDPEKALNFSKKKGIRYKVVEEPYISELSKRYSETKKVPPGCRVVQPGPDRPYIK